MSRPSLIAVADSANVPLAEVPCDWMWDLVEYLSYQRVVVHYNFKETHFTATFPKQRLASVQKLLDDWSQASEVEVCTN